MNIQSCSIDNTLNNQKCQKFTNPSIADEMLDAVGYVRDLMGKKVLETSFGSGVFLKRIIVRYISDSLSTGKTLNLISKGLSVDIFGFEVDESLFKKTVSDLNEITDQHNIPRVKWALFCHDALSFDYHTKFDFVVGNPPYLNYKNNGAEIRAILRNSFESCKYG